MRPLTGRPSGPTQPARLEGCRPGPDSPGHLASWGAGARGRGREGPRGGRAPLTQSWGTALRKADLQRHPNPPRKHPRHARGGPPAAGAERWRREHSSRHRRETASRSESAAPGPQSTHRCHRFDPKPSAASSRCETRARGGQTPTGHAGDRGTLRGAQRAGDTQPEHP